MIVTIFTSAYVPDPRTRIIFNTLEMSSRLNYRKIRTCTPQTITIAEILKETIPPYMTSIQLVRNVLAAKPATAYLAVAA